MTLENGMVLAAAACNYGYGWDEDPEATKAARDAYEDDLYDAYRDEMLIEHGDLK